MALTFRVVKLYAGVDLRVVFLDDKGGNQGLGIPSGNVLDLLIAQDHRHLGLARVGQFQGVRSDLPPDKTDILVVQRLFGQVGDDDDRMLLAVGHDVGHQILPGLVPTADNHVPLLFQWLRSSVPLGSVIDDLRCQPGGETAQKTDPQQHQGHAHRSAFGRLGKEIPVSHRGDGDHCPPEAVLPSFFLEEMEGHPPRQDQRQREQGDPDQGVALDRAPEVDEGQPVGQHQTTQTISMDPPM